MIIAERPGLARKDWKMSEPLWEKPFQDQGYRLVDQRYMRDYIPFIRKQRKVRYILRDTWKEPNLMEQLV